MAVARLKTEVNAARRWAVRVAAPTLGAKWYLRNARSVGPNPQIVGRPHITSAELVVGADLLIWSHTHRTVLGGTGRLSIGDRVFINTGAQILAFDEVELGDDVAIASGVFVSDSDNHPLAGRPVRTSPVRIGAGAWIATRAMILPGVQIGSRAVVAAGSVVTKDVPPDTLAGGVPARTLRELDYPPGRRTAWRDEY